MTRIAVLLELSLTVRAPAQALAAVGGWLAQESRDGDVLDLGTGARRPPHTALKQGAVMRLGRRVTLEATRSRGRGA